MEAQVFGRHGNNGVLFSSRCNGELCSEIIVKLLTAVKIVPSCPVNCVMK